MGIRSSRFAFRDGSDSSETERSSSKLLGSESSFESDNDQLPVVSSVGQSHWQQTNSQDPCPLELQERRADPGMRILSRTRHVNIAPLARFCLRNNGRPTEVQTRHTGEQERGSERTNTVTFDSDTSVQGQEQRDDSLQASDRYSRSSQWTTASTLPNYDRINANNRMEVVNSEIGRNSFWDTLTYTVSQRRHSNDDFRDDREPVFVLYNTRGRSLSRRSERSNSFHVERDYRRSRNLTFEERRRRFRSQVWALQQLSTRFERMPIHSRRRDEDTDQYPGSPLSHEEAATRASISRILMLAEALFQVLEDIHRQSVEVPRSTGLSLGYLPAPLAVVENMPSKLFHKGDASDNKDDAALQCHICLMEYEEGDQMRILPCNHHYHMTCIDKWLSEVHRVCPLCRRDVCEFRSPNDSM